ncbi:MAG: Zn-dependent exopeptidase M28 [Acidobacteria bacterium]|nr:MAG: Zn-dependent exopeptidase M28 [Acidobacteriota bacterium]
MKFALAVGLPVRSRNLLLLIFLVLGSRLRAQDLVSSAESLLSDLTDIQCDNKMRQQAVRDLFARMGASETEITDRSYRKVTNVVLEVPGTTNERIIIGAHYDKSRIGCGAIDNWTGIVILAHLYRTIRAAHPNKNFVFVAFGREEEGLLGSKAMLESIPKEERRNYCAMVNLDSFGMARPQALENVSTAKLVELARKVAKENDIPFAFGTVATAGADSDPFRFKGIPALTLHGLASRYHQVIHTPADTEAEVDLGSVYLGYRFALRLVAHLDKCDCSDLR